MCRRGYCSDNAVTGSFFNSRKKERRRKSVYKTRELPRADVFDYIEVFCNRTRRHTHTGGISPEVFEGPSAQDWHLFWNSEQSKLDHRINLVAY